MAILLDRLGEDPDRIPDRQLHKTAAAFTTPESGDVAYKDTTESADAPVIVIRDLATDTTVRPTANTKSIDAVLDDLISPDLALTLISMYALVVLFLQPSVKSTSLTIEPDFWNIMADGSSMSRKMTRISSSSE